MCRKNDDGRNADRRLANRRLQPLGHLTAEAKCTRNQHLADPHFTLREATVFQTVAIVEFDCAWRASNLSHSQRAAGQMETTNDATRLLEAWRQGVAGAADTLFALVYDDLRTLARRQLARLNAGQRKLRDELLDREIFYTLTERRPDRALDHNQNNHVAE
jgi:ECF sigma factor